MAEAGGSAATWQVLLLVRSKAWATQSELADAMGVTAATLTHHLNAAEAEGLVRRWREPDNRRVQRVELTAAGVAMFDRLRRVAGAHDRRLRSRLTETEAERLIELLDRVRGSVEPAPRQAARADA
jgi:MarR family transcriptional regulator, transcriptional regulator for hemolysin